MCGVGMVGVVCVCYVVWCVFVSSVWYVVVCCVCVWFLCGVCVCVNSVCDCV